ncbi:maleylpyruvate isomerase family mycothiol-dependent enzyme, partial [Pseudonocardia pini]|uniref:maleylpyruvate isomerase family mycothiol-dependent enzyme n=1 Tax=Pseudonocardia pini TaxID=2758030 RepID=UPI0015F05210
MTAASTTALTAALRTSHDRLVALVEPLDADGVRQPSYDPGWPIAQVVSHLGSQAEIFGLFLDTALGGAEPPAPERFPEIWGVWDAKDPAAQAADGLAADRTFLERVEGLTEEQRSTARLDLFGAERDLADLLRMRLGEHALHTWDVAVALDDTATLAPDAVDLLVDGLDQIVGGTGRAEALPGPVGIRTTAPERAFLLTPGETGVALTEGAAEESAEESAEGPTIPAEAFVRLVYGRLDPAHTPAFPRDEGLLAA